MKKKLIIVLVHILVLAAVGYSIYPINQPEENPQQEVLKAGLIIPIPKKVLEIETVSGKIHRGESLWDVFLKNKIAREDIQPAIDAFNKLSNSRRIQPGQKYEIEQDLNRNLISYRFYPDLLTVFHIEKDSLGNFISRVVHRPMEKRTESISGTVNSTLYESVIEQGGSVELIYKFTDIFQWDIDFFTDPQPGDSYKIVVESFYLDDQFIQYGDIMAAQYSLDGKPLTSFLRTDAFGIMGYYNWEGKSFQKAFLKSPLNYRRISSYFSLRRYHPILKRRRPHLGVDYAASYGTPVEASADGVVIETGFKKYGVGRYIKIKHPYSQFSTLYGHLSKYAKKIKKGVKVTQGQVIGYVGSTGLATGPHLHYSFYENGRPVNPFRIKNYSTKPIPADRLETFRTQSLSMLGELAGLPDGNSTYCQFQF